MVASRNTSVSTLNDVCIYIYIDKDANLFQAPVSQRSSLASTVLHVNLLGLVGSSRERIMYGVHRDYIPLLPTNHYS